MMLRGPFALLVLLASGCTVDSLLNKIDRQGEKTVDLACSCSNVFPDRDMCEMQFSSFFDFIDRDCLEDALAEDKDGSKDYLECVLDQAKAYNRCLEDKLDCNDPQSVQGCQSVLGADCPVPAAVQQKVSACGEND